MLSEIKEGQVVQVIVEREGGLIKLVRSRPAKVIRLGKDRATVEFKDGSKKRVAYSSIIRG